MAASQALERQRQRLLAERLGLIKRVTIAYMKVIAAQEQLKLSTERTDLAQTLFNEIQQRVAAARAPQMQLNQAGIALTTARLRQETHGRELQHSQHVLASFWLMRHEDYRYDATPFFQLIEPIDEQEMEARLREHPVLQSWRMEQKRQQALLALENAEATPDLSVQLGVREFRETGDQGLVIGFSIPLPIFNRNQGNIERASALLGKSASDEQNAWLNLTGDGLQALEDTINAYRQAVTLSQSVIPAAEQGFTLAHEGYIAGRFPYLEVLSAQRTLFDSKESYLAALAHYQVAKARVDYVIATYLGVRQ
jgi:cobalt-zinc-cadmium efflux system outer membrane protein